MRTKVFQVRAPDGQILNIKGPEDATDEELAGVAAANWKAGRTGTERGRGTLTDPKPLTLADAAPAEPRGTPANTRPQVKTAMPWERTPEQTAKVEQIQNLDNGGSVLDRPTDPLTNGFRAASEQQRAISDRAVKARDERMTSANIGPATPMQVQAMNLNEEGAGGIKRGAIAGGAQLGQIGLGAMRMVGDLTGSDTISGIAQAGSKAAEGTAGAAMQGLEGGQKLTAEITSSIINSAPALALGVIGGPALTTLFAQSTLSEYNAGRNAGFDPAASLTRAGIMGLGEALGEKFGLSEQIKLIKGMAKGLPQGEVAQLFGTMLAKEIPGEQLTTAVQFLADKIGPAALNPNATLADYLEAAADTLKVTIGQSLVMGGGPAAVSTARNTFRQADAATAAPESGVAAEIQAAATRYESFYRPAATPDKPLMPTQARTESVKRFDELAAAFGLNPKAAARVREQAGTLPSDEVPGFLARATDALNRRKFFRRPVDDEGVSRLAQIVAPPPATTESTDVNQPDVAGTAPGSAGASDAGMADAGPGGVAVGRVAADAGGEQPGIAPAVVAGSAGPRAGGDGARPDPALSLPASTRTPEQAMAGMEATLQQDYADTKQAGRMADAPDFEPREASDILNPKGSAWAAKIGARKRLKELGDGFRLARVSTGWVIKPETAEAAAPVEPVNMTPERVEKAPAIEQVTQPDAAAPQPPAEAPRAEAAAPPAVAGTAEPEAAVPGAPAASVEADGLTGEKIDAEWTAFAPESGTRAVPRAEMPQIKAEHRGAMVQFLKGRGITHEQDADVDPRSLKPTQAEFSPAKVAKAAGFTGGDRSILVSADGHVLDGHHQWMAKRQAGEPVRVIRLNAPIEQLLAEVREFPSAGTADGATTTPAEVRSSPTTAPTGKAVMPAGLRVTFGGKTYPVESIEDAQRKWIAFQEETGGGVSEVGNGVRVTDGAGRFVARISYNGRAWDSEDDRNGGGKVIAEAPATRPRVKTIEKPADGELRREDFINDKAWRAAIAERDGAAAPAPAPQVASQPAPPPGYEAINHTTGKGKVLRGVVVKGITGEEALKLDGATMKKDGGYFVREKHWGRLPAVSAAPAAAPAPAPTGRGPTVVVNNVGADGLTDAERAAGNLPYSVVSLFDAAARIKGASEPVKALAGFKTGQRVKVNGRTIGESTVEFLYSRTMAGFGRPEAMARIVNDAGKRLDVLVTEIESVAASSPAPAAPETVEPENLAALDAALASGKRVHYDYAGTDGRTLWIEETPNGWVLKDRGDGESTTYTKGGANATGGWSKSTALRTAREVAEFRFTKWKPTAAAAQSPVAAPAASPVQTTASREADARAIGAKAYAEDADRVPPQAFTTAEKRAWLDGYDNAPPRPSKAPATAPAPSANTVFTEDAAAAARARLKAKLGRVQSGLDPETLIDGITLAGYHVERGARTFAAYARAMVGDMGDVVKPYLQQWYMALRADPKAVNMRASMDKASAVEDLTAAEIDALVADPSAPDSTPAPEAQNAGQEAPNGDATRQLDRPGQRALEGAPADPVQAPDAGRDAGRSPEGSGSTDGGRPAGAEGASGPAGSVGDGAGALPVSSRGAGRKPRGESKPRAGRNARPDAEPGLFGDGAGPDSQGLTAPNVAPPAPAAFTPTDFEITDDLALGEGGQKAKYRGNVEAIRLLRDLEATGRTATQAEQRILARYVGWGGIAQVFDASNKDWAREYAELKELLTPAEWATANESTQYAHYTSREIIGGIYDALARMGFTGGKVLEPGSGVGNFVGLMPAGLRTATRFTGVEREALAVGIAKQLYPQQNIQRADFTEFIGNDGYFDLAIGNPPFARNPLTDKSGRKHLTGLSVHNYFFAKAVDMLREGGILAQVVSNSFLDAKRDTARRYIADRTEFLGAIRLPNNAFAKNANTEVTTDIVFLRKLPEAEWGSRSGKENRDRWLETEKVTDPNGGDDIAINKYFADNPEMMLGRMGRFGTMYGPGQPALVARPGQDTAALLKAAIARLPEGVYTAPAVANTAAVTDAAIVALKNPQVQEGGHYVEGDKLYQRLQDIAGEARAVELTPSTMWTEKTRLGDDGHARIKALAGLRKTLRALLAAELADAKDIAPLRARLNEEYDAYVKKHGLINDRPSLRVFDDDPDYPLLASLEHGFTPGITSAAAKKMGVKPMPATAKKGPIFSARVIEKRTAPSRAESPADALNISMAERGRIDAGYIGSLLGREGEEALREMSTGDKPLLFMDPASNEYVLRDAYLSGNVRAKLAQARQAGMMNNARALEAVQPPDVSAGEISVRVGSPWVPAGIYEEFARSLFGDGTKAKFTYVKANSSYMATISSGSDVADSTTWGTSNYPGTQILTSLMNNREIKVMYKDSDGSLKVDKDATDAANQKASEIKQAFSDWAFADSDRADVLAKAYNEANNNYVTRAFDGGYMQFPGKVPDSIIKFRRHQRNAIARIVQDRTSLLDHVVGAGKTFTVISAAMELKRTGLANKPLIMVPNHLVKQWASDFYRLYPGANILTATKKDFEKTNRRRFLAKIATGNWDAVIMAHSSFGFIKPAPEFEAQFNEKQVENVMATIQAVEDGDADESTKKRTVKQLAALKERLENRIDALRQKPIDALLDFKEIGVDQLFVDEAHLFKNLMFTTKMQNVRGLGDSAGSQRAYDLFIKANQLYAQNGRGQGVVFATGTPVSNSLAEMYHMMRYLMPQPLQDGGFESFDAWANTFASVEQVWMQKISANGFKADNRMSNFVNTHELLKMFDQVADTVTMDDIKRAYAEENDGAEFPLPKLKNGRRQPVSLVKSEAQEAYMTAIAARASAIEGKRTNEKGMDNALKIMGDARKAAMDIRLVDMDRTERDKGGRIDRAAQEIESRYRQYNDVKGTQLVFSDLGTPIKHAKAEMKEWEALQARIDKGVDPETVTAANLGNEAAMKVVDDAEDAQREMEEKGADWLDAVKAALRGFSVYDDLRTALVERGIPDAEIAFIHDYNTDEQKLSLFRKVNAGEIRVLIGSTPKLGAGTNVQERLVALHHLDVPWKPSDVEQREGRIIRQGNKLMGTLPGFEVEILAYVTQDTLDMRMWQVQETKLRMINQLRTRQIGREIDNAFEDMEMSAGEMQAAATGNMDLLKEIQLRTDVKKLEQAKRSFDAQRNDLASRKKRAEEAVSALPAKIASADKMAAASMAYTGEQKAQTAAFKVTINGKAYTDPREAGAVLQEFVDAKQYTKKDDDRVLTAEEFRGLPDEERFGGLWGSRPVPLKVEMEGKTYTARAALGEAFADLRGDAADPPMWKVDGQTFIRRTKAAAAIAQRVADAMADSKVVEVGKIGPFAVTVEGQGENRYYEGSVGVEVLIRAPGGVEASTTLNVRGGASEDDARKAATSIINAAMGLASGGEMQARWLREDLDRQKKVLADLATAKTLGEFPQQAKLDEARAAHREVLARLAAKPEEAKPAEDSQGAETAFSRRPPPRVATTTTPEGYLEFAAGDVTIAFPQPAERFEVIPEPSQQVLSYAIMPAAGFDVLGHVELLMQNGRPVSLLDIEVYRDKGRSQGVGRAVVRALLAANPGQDLNISNIVPEARGFWEKMGVPQQNVEGAYDGTLSWQTYTENARAAQGDAPSGGAAGENRKAGRPGARESASGQGPQGVDGALSRGTGPAGVSIEDAQAAKAALERAMPKAPRINVLERVEQAPESLLDKIRREGAMDDVEGAFHEGEVYIFPGNIESLERLQFVMAHHELRHFGLRSLMPSVNARGALLLSIYQTNPAMRAAADAKIKDGLATSRVLGTEEALADMPVEDVAALKGGPRLLAAIRAVLRKLSDAFRGMGWTRVADAIEPKTWTDADVLALIKRAEDVSRTGGPLFRVGGTAFSRRFSSLRGMRPTASYVDATRRQQATLDVIDEGPDSTDYDLLPAKEDINRAADAAFTDWEQERGIKYVPLSMLGPLTGYNNAKDTARIRRLADSIKESNTFEPIFVGIDPNGEAFIMEGQHRARALQLLGDTHVPAQVIVDMTGTEADYDAEPDVSRVMPTDYKAAQGQGALFSRRPTTPEAQAAEQKHKATARTAEMLHDYMKDAGTLSFYSKSIGLPYNLAQRYPAFKRAFDAFQRQISDVADFANSAADLAPGILPKLERVRDLVRGPLNAQDAEAIQRPIFDGTLLWTRDAQGKPVRVEKAEEAAGEMSADDKARKMMRDRKLDPRVMKMWQGQPMEWFEAVVEKKYAAEYLRPGIVWTAEELRTIFKLTPAQVKLYQQFRAATDRSLDTLAVTTMVRLTGEPTLRSAVLGMSPSDAADYLRPIVEEQAREAALKAGRSDEKADKAAEDAGNKVSDIADRAEQLKAEGYAPLMRFGSRYVKVIENGEMVYFTLYESALQRVGDKPRIRKMFPDGEIQSGTVPQEAYKLFEGVTPETLAMFADVAGLTDEQDKSDLFQTYLREAVSQRSAMKRLIQRKGIAGFNEDVPRVLAAFVTSNARLSATNLNTKPMMDAIEAIDPKDNRTGQGELQDYAQKLYDFIRAPEGQWAGLRSFLFHWFLGGNISSAIVNMQQPFQVTIPELSKLVGTVEASAQVGNAVRTLFRKKTGPLGDAMKRAEIEGKVAPQEFFHLLSISQGSGHLRSGKGAVDTAVAMTGNGITRLAFVWGRGFALAEQFNRRVTFVAGWNAAVKAKHPNPYKYAIDLIDASQFVYNAGNKPVIARTGAGATLLTFQTYKISMLEMMARNLKTPEGRKALAVMLLIMLLSSGLDGLPFMENIEDIVDAIAQRSLGINFSLKESFKQFIRALFDKIVDEEMATLATQFVTKGITGALGPVDLAGRFSMAKILPGTGALPLTQNPGTALLDVLGPAGSLVRQMGEAAAKVAGGDIAAGAEKALPVAGANLFKGAQMAMTGQYRDGKERDVIAVDKVDAMFKGAGFQPNVVARPRAAERVQQRRIEVNKIAEDALVLAMARAIRNNDDPAFKAAIDRLERWNERNPENPIGISQQQVRARLKNMESTSAERLVKRAPKETRGSVAEEVAR